MQEAPFNLQVVGGLFRDSLSKAGTLTLHGTGGSRMGSLGEAMCKGVEAKETWPALKGRSSVAVQSQGRPGFCSLPPGVSNLSGT